MDDETAYQLTKTHWENKTKLGEAAKWWDGVSLEMLANILTDIHPGAKRYYQDVGASLAAHHQDRRSGFGRSLLSIRPMTEKSHRWIWVSLGAKQITFQIWLIFSGLVPSLVSRPIHMALALPWVFVFASNGIAQRRFRLLLTIVGSLFFGFIALDETALSDQYGVIFGGWQLMVGVGLILLMLEMARRTISWPLPLINMLFVLYGLFGSHVLSEFGHPGLPLKSFLGTLVITEGGLWGKLTGVSVSVVAVFVVSAHS